MSKSKKKKTFEELSTDDAVSQMHLAHARRALDQLTEMCLPSMVIMYDRESEELFVASDGIEPLTDADKALLCKYLPLAVVNAKDRK